MDRYVKTYPSGDTILSDNVLPEGACSDSNSVNNFNRHGRISPGIFYKFHAFKKNER